MSRDLPDRNLLDELSEDAPMERMRSRFEGVLVRRRRSRRWMSWAAAVALPLLGALWLRHAIPPAAPGGPAPAVFALLASESTFDRIGGIYASAELLATEPELLAALFEKLERDESVNVRLAAADVALDHLVPGHDPDRLVAAVLAQEAEIVQAHLAYRLNRRSLLSEEHLGRLLADPELGESARRQLDGWEKL